MDSLQSGDWRSKCETVQERWCEARRRNLYTDVDFLVGKGDSARNFSAHKCMLASSSPVFEAMFYGALAERKSPIAIVDIDPKDFETLLGHVYGSTIVFPTVLFAVKTYIVADKYIVTDLQSLAENHIVKATFDDKQFWEVIHQDTFFQIPVVKKRCLDYIAEKASILFQSFLFINVSPNVIEAILQMDQILISEFELLCALTRWGHGNIEAESNLRNKIAPLLRYIRFSNLTFNEFCQFNDNHPSLIDIHDSFSIIKHIHDKSMYELPQWCSTSSKERNATTTKKLDEHIYPNKFNFMASEPYEPYDCYGDDDLDPCDDDLDPDYDVQSELSYSDYEC